MFAKITKSTAVALALTLSVAACDNPQNPQGSTSVVLSSSSSSAALASAFVGGTTGNVALSDVGSINVTVTEVQALPAGGDEATDAAWLSFGLEPVSLDLMKLDLSGVKLAEEQLQAGTYGNLRLFFSSAKINLLNDVTIGTKVFAAGEHDLFIPSGAQTGIKIPSASFTVTEDSMKVVTVSFDAAASVQGIQAGGNGVIMTPVLGGGR